MSLADFDYELPPDRIAQAPLAERDAARLLVHDLASGASTHRRVRDLPAILEPGDLVVLNDTRVLPARVFGRRESGGRVEVLLLEPRAAEGGRAGWSALVRPARRLRPGERVLVSPELAVRLVERVAEPGGAAGREWVVALEGEPSGGVEDLLEGAGVMPLPPYIERPQIDETGGGSEELRRLDRERYQTVFARAPGAVAAPTAGLHFTPGLLERLRARGIEVATVTLHVGAGTFLPLPSETIEEIRLHSERIELPQETADAVVRTRASGGRIVCVGTTSVRTLESRADEEGRLAPGAGTTDLFLRPGSRFRVTDALLTNFHLPRSSLLLLVAAFAGRERVLGLYREALERGYRFLSYGDAMLFLRPRTAAAPRH